MTKIPGYIAVLLSAAGAAAIIAAPATLRLTPPLLCNWSQVPFRSTGPSFLTTAGVGSCPGHVRGLSAVGLRPVAPTEPAYHREAAVTVWAGPGRAGPGAS
jgi:hypothetical protein